ncbi:MAG TPA: kelch repeat-containing protein, partial [Chloroflexota bacterium]|nr:kelch repeat-containing protein [Chloroflexota bacterium]
MKRICLVAALAAVGSALLISPAPAPAQTGSTSEGGTWQPAENMSTGRYAPATVRLPDNRVLVAGGHTGNGETTGAQIYDSTANAWTTAGSLKRARNFPVTLLVDEDKNGTDETALIFGGYNSSY